MTANTVHVEANTLFPGGVVAQRVVVRDHTGRLVQVVAVDYQLSVGRTLGQVADDYARLRGWAVNT